MQDNNHLHVFVCQSETFIDVLHLNDNRLEFFDASHLSTLQILGLDRNQLKFLKGNTSLTHLSVESQRSSDCKMELSNCTELKSLNVSGKVLDRLNVR